MNKFLPAIRLCLFLLVALPLTASAIFLDQIDDFTEGTTNNWTIGNPGSPFAPINVPSGGPFDTGESPDAFLELSSSGVSGSGGKLTTFNTSQWTGDYIGSGVTGISAYFNNTGSNPVTMRLGFGGAGAIFGTQHGFTLTPGSGWQEVTFSLSASDLTLISGSGSFEQTFADIAEIRILSSVNPAFSGDQIAATVGVDNIAAIPEPSSIFLLLAGTAGLALARRVKDKKSLGLS